MKAIIWNHDICIEPEELDVWFGFTCRCQAPVCLDGIPARVNFWFDPTDPATPGELHSGYDESKVSKVTIPSIHSTDTMYNGYCVECGAGVTIAMRKLDGA
jgi:hypothetical protein